MPTPKRPKRKRARILLATIVATERVAELQNPSDDELREQLLSLPGPEVASCVKLQRSKTVFLAANGNEELGFQAGHQEYSEAGVWSSVDTSIPLDTMLAVLRSYADDDEQWRTLIRWQRRPPEKQKPVPEPSLGRQLLGLAWYAFTK